MSAKAELNPMRKTRSASLDLIKHKAFYQNTVDQIQIFHGVVQADFQDFLDLFQTVLEGIAVDIHHFCRTSDIEAAEIVIEQGID